jgi:hypothetical protein
MDQTTITENTKRIISTTFILILISSFVLIVISASMRSVNKDIKKLDYFLSNAEGIQVNFEESLRIYTDRTKTITDYLLSLRPENEQQYIKFISDVEKLGQDLSIDLTLQSSEQTPKTLSYIVSFEANYSKMKEFLDALEKLPYFIQIGEIDFTNPVFYTNSRTVADGNIKLKIKLYIK